MTNVTRRLLIKAFPFIGLVVATPVLAIEPQPEVEFDLQNWLDTAPSRAVAEYHLSELTKSMRKLRPGSWTGKFTTHEDGELAEALVLRDPNSSEDESWVSWDIPLSH